MAGEREEAPAEESERQRYYWDTIEGELSPEVLERIDRMLEEG